MTVKRTVVYGPWQRQSYRDQTYKGLTPGARKRARRFKMHGLYWIEMWPQGTRMGSPGVVRAPRPTVATGMPGLTYLHSGNQSARTSPIDGIVWHETEGSFKGAVSWLRNPASRVSAHLVISDDGSQVIQLVGWDRRAWHARGANDYTIGIELTGTGDTPNAGSQLQVAARIGAYLSRRFDVPPTIAPGSSGHGGHSRHKDLAPGNSDPGGFNWRAFMSLLHREYMTMGVMPRQWGV